MQKPSTRWVVGILSAVVITAQVPFLVSAEKSLNQMRLEQVKTQQEVVKLQGNLNKTTSTLNTEKAKNQSLEAQLGEAKNELTTAKQEVQSVKKQWAQMQANKRKSVTTTHASGSGTSQKVVKYVVNALATAYNANGGGINGPGHITATGTACVPGVTLSVDPNVIPLGSEVEITCPDYPSINGRYIAQDTGSAIKGNRVDIAMNSNSESFQFGKHMIQIAVLQGGRS